MSLPPPQALREAVLDQIHAHGWIASSSWLATVDSTNLAAKRALASTASLPALFVADEQTAGRGRGEHQWWSPAGCLMLTLALGNDGAPTDRSQWALLGLVCGVAVADTISQWIPPEQVQLKWPNDIYLGRQKLSGMLIESYSAPQAGWLIGIGLNVNIDWERAPAGLRDQATCISSSRCQALEPEIVLPTLLEKLETRIRQWQAGGEEWFDEWLHRCLLSGQVIRVKAAGQQIIGRCEGIDRSGRLLIRDELTVHALASAEILAWR
ncbi:Bifunctional ligase/repressor BirA [Aureliella helgolandensis]|uniref:Bifunctional ligase/repressor BirA n=1 Tax=Aureliella helgolandensis TaxID=2527968 RepID=A0A518G321_9BACT|nr:Bifunctional ligase/repressor BirA [Aureliella helgolandensis]